MTPNILISCSVGGGGDYEAAISSAGGHPVAAHCPPPDTSYDGLVLCGGGGVDPACYGQEAVSRGSIDPPRDVAELLLARAYLDAGKPILGVCRGHQIVNVVLGGTLLTLTEALRPFHNRWPDQIDKVHPIRALEGSLLGGLYGKVFLVNSAHHHAPDRLGEGLKAVAWSESGIIEGLEHESLPVLCVQFHPERMTGIHRRTDTVDGGLLFQWLVDTCKSSA